MANLKQDLINNLGNEKYYNELELARLASDPNMNYREKVNTMTYLLKELASIDLSTQLIGKYFPDQDNISKEPQPEQPKPHPGQTHGE